MRVDVLHKRLVHDIVMLQPVVDPILPVVLPDQYLNRSMNLRAFIDRLNTATTPDPFTIYNEIEIDKTVEPGQVQMSGLWLGDAELPENGSDADIRILWHVHPSTKRLQLTQAEWQRRRFTWWQYTMHELIHRHQSVHRTLTGVEKIKEFVPRTTSRSLKEDQNYLGNYDEIEAHSHNAALELTTWFPGATYKDALYAVLTYSGRTLTPHYTYFTTTFMDTPNHPAYRTFKRKVKSWFDVMTKNPEVYRNLQLPRLVG